MSQTQLKPPIDCDYTLIELYFVRRSPEQTANSNRILPIDMDLNRIQTTRSAIENNHLGAINIELTPSNINWLPTCFLFRHFETATHTYTHTQNVQCYSHHCSRVKLLTFQYIKALKARNKWVRHKTQDGFDPSFQVYACCPWLLLCCAQDCVLLFCSPLHFRSVASRNLCFDAVFLSEGAYVCGLLIRNCSPLSFFYGCDNLDKRFTDMVGKWNIHRESL